MVISKYTSHEKRVHTNLMWMIQICVHFPRLLSLFDVASLPMRYLIDELISVFITCIVIFFVTI